MAGRFYVTTPIYYINDVPHLGTAYTTIVADVLRRYHQLRGEDTFFLTGTDEHGLKIERVARERSVSPKAFADEMSAPFRAAWRELSCECDHFVRTTDPQHEAAVQELWKRVEAAGDLYLGAYEGWYCVGCEAYYTEKELEPGNLCPLHKKPVEKVREPSYFFRLSKYQDRLLALYEEHPDFVMPPGRLNEVRSFVAGGLEDLSVSRTTFDWGVPVPGDPKHVMYVWFDALANYWSAVQEPAERRRFWPANLHLVGKDILRFHAVYWPAFLMSAGLPLPEHVFAHGWLTINGQKMSKSLRNAVSPIGLARAFGVDTLRYYLTSAVALGQDGDFNLKDLVQRYNAELGNALGNLLNRTLPQCAKHFENKVPPKDHARRTPHEEDLAASLAKNAAIAAEAFDQCAPHRAASAIWDFIRDVNGFVDKTAPWAAAKAGDRETLGRILTTCLEALEVISRMIWPVLPGKSGEIRAQLGLPAFAPSSTPAWPRELSERDAGDPLGVAAPIFPRIDPDREKELVASLGLPGEGAPAAAAGAEKPGNVPGHPSAPSEGTASLPAIAYDDFAKVDLRVGVVVAAERVPNKDKLLSLKVDLGEGEPRSIVAGLALSFAPSTLVGQRVVVVANLEPRKFGKLVSHGMILATGPSESLALVTVPEGVAPGTKAK